MFWNKEKSNNKHSQIVTFLGFVFNSVDVTISISNDNMIKINKEILRFLDIKRYKVRDFAYLIDFLVFFYPSVQYDGVYTKLFERGF